MSIGQVEGTFNLALCRNESSEPAQFYFKQRHRQSKPSFIQEENVISKCEPSSTVAAAVVSKPGERKVGKAFSKL